MVCEGLTWFSRNLSPVLTWSTFERSERRAKAFLTSPSPSEAERLEVEELPVDVRLVLEGEWRAAIERRRWWWCERRSVPFLSDSSEATPLL
jgi:hypothetical protein